MFYHAFSVNNTVARHKAGVTYDGRGELGHTASACETHAWGPWGLEPVGHTSLCGSCGDMHARGTACDPAKRNRFIRTCVTDGGASLMPRMKFSRQ